MPYLGVNTAIINQDGALLLTRREDFEIWCIPGGAVDDGESLAEAAIREAYEETGLQVELTRFVGMYSLPSWLGRSLHIALFAARPVGGEMRLCPGETVEIGFFDPHNLPSPIGAEQGRQIADALSGAGGGVAWKQEGFWTFDSSLTTREQLYAHRDQSGLARQEYYLRYSHAQSTETLQVNGSDKPPK
jgi:ADP-ribose pyrophosphatase YjhB (NUDIX family)